jgi:hypothetical protein
VRTQRTNNNLAGTGQFASEDGDKCLLLSNLKHVGSPTTSPHEANGIMSVTTNLVEPFI